MSLSKIRQFIVLQDELLNKINTTSKTIINICLNKQDFNEIVDVYGLEVSTGREYLTATLSTKVAEINLFYKFN